MHESRWEKLEELFKELDNCDDDEEVAAQWGVIKHELKKGDGGG